MIKQAIKIIKRIYHAFPRPMRRALRFSFGWGFIIFGILGLFLPVLQGVLFLFIGAYLLNMPWAHNFVKKIKKKLNKKK